MDSYMKQWHPEYMTGTSTADAMGIDMSVSPGTVIRPDMSLGSGQAKSSDNGTNPILMKQQDMASNPCPCMPPMSARTTPIKCPNLTPAPCPPENIDQYPVGMAYVPWQCWQEVYSVDVALSMGTIFPDLNLPFTMGGCR